jgi:hypothetical protein
MFAGVLTQKMKTTLPRGNTVTRLHLIAYVSKRTLPVEEKYKAFLLEFAVLKYSLDKFSDIVWGLPIKLHTDCRALCNVLLSDKLNATHTRWCDGVLAYNIIDVEHIPGTTNIADSLSRQFEGHPKEDRDGSEWTVDPAWELTMGLPRDALNATVLEEHSALLECFKDKPLYWGVIKALLNLQDTKSSLHKEKEQVTEQCNT